MIFNEGIGTTFLLFFMVVVFVKQTRFHNTLTFDTLWYFDALCYKTFFLHKTSPIRLTIDRFNEEQKLLKAKIKEQKKILKIISHDIISPLRYIALTAQKIQLDNTLTQEQTKKYLNSLSIASQRLYQFSIGLIDYATVDDYRDKRRFNVNSIIEEKILLYEEFAKSKGITLINATYGTILVSINKKAIAIIVQNLIDNAIKYTENGIVTCCTTLQNNNLIITIQDSGRGMREDELLLYNNIVKNFSKRQRKQTPIGNGLLFIAQLLNKMAGDIEFISNNKGTLVTVILPLKKASKK